jgi:hypothetical protein
MQEVIHQPMQSETSKFYHHLLYYLRTKQVPKASVATPSGNHIQQKRPSEMSALDRLKHIQSTFKINWKGINCEYAGRPGTSNFVNKKRMFTTPEGSV